MPQSQERGRSSKLLLHATLEALNRPYRVTPAMVVLVCLVPLYIFIPAVLFPGRTLHTPGVWVDEVIPLFPTWAFVYGALYLFLIVLPVLILRDEEHIRRTVLAYLLVWVSAYICFIAYPTVLPRPQVLARDALGAWGLGLLYSADPPYNCFPSLHVAHSFVSAFACYRLHRPLGVACGVAASLVGLSTLLTKQHYVLDVAAGILLALIAYVALLRRYSPAGIRQLDRQVATTLAVGLLSTLLFAVAGLYVLHHLRVG